MQREVEISWHVTFSQVDCLSSMIKIKSSIFKTDGTQHRTMLPSIPIYRVQWSERLLAIYSFLDGTL